MSEQSKAPAQARPPGPAPVEVQKSPVEELAGGTRTGDPIDLARLLDIPVRVEVSIGRTQIALAELVQLGPGSLVVLDREAHAPADILVNGRIVAQGEVVTIDGSYGVRITSVARPDAAA